MEIATLLNSLEMAFQERPIPEISLRQATLTDQSMSRLIPEREWRAEKKKDGHLTWKDLSDEALIECEPGLAHLIEESFTYYLGAFLSFAIRHLEADVLDKEWGLGRVHSNQI